MIVSKKRVVYVLNEIGLYNIDTIEFYDKYQKINSIETIHYDARGIEIKKYQRKDLVFKVLPMGIQFSRMIGFYILILLL